LEEVRALRLKQYSIVDAAKKGRLEAERASGEHFRREIFEKTPTPEALEEREWLQKELEIAKREVEGARARLKSLLREQSNVAKEDEAQRLHERRRNIELEAELQRVKLVRSALLASTNLDHAGRRPSAWWFPLVSPDGSWFRETIATAQCRFEPLSFRTAVSLA
jgi:ribosomal protein L16 Arg81 hydroxylase